jgi:hypothetical protein
VAHETSRAAVLTAKSLQIFPTFSESTQKPKVYAMRIPLKTASAAFAKSHMHGRSRDESAVYLPLLTTYFRFDRNPASLYLWAAHGQALRSEDIFQAALDAGVCTWHACELVMMSTDHFCLEMLLKSRHHAADYILKMSDPESPIWAATAAWKLKNRLLNVYRKGLQK